MCTNYKPSARDAIQEHFRAAPPADITWPDETYQDYLVPIIVSDPDLKRRAIIAAFSMVPKQHIPPGVKRYSTMNARAETVGQLKSYSGAWKKCQLCLVPMKVFYEPNWKTGVHERWGIAMADQQDFAVAGLWRDWTEQDGATLHAFTQLTVNADEHPLMRRFHKRHTK